MSTDKQQPDMTTPAQSTATDAQSSETPAAPPSLTEVTLSYAEDSKVVSEGGEATLKLFGNLHRDPVHLDAQMKDPVRVREALSALFAVVSSDFRYVPKDRSAYNAYRRMRNESANLNAWQAQQAYFSWLRRNDPLAFLVLDPIISVHPDQLLLEVFSKDEGAYAKLGIDLDQLDVTGTPQCGTTNIDFSDALFNHLQGMRSYRKNHFNIGQQAVSLTVEQLGERLEKTIQVPDSWLRGCLQIQSAAMLARDHFTLAPMDLYNLLRTLRLQADKKGQRRGLRVELVPGEYPRIVLEPWETVIETQEQIYRGNQAKVVRIWGRRRLSLLQRFLPFAQRIDVYTMGSGLPSFWVLRGNGLTLTLGLTGFTAANWAQSTALDLILARKTKASTQLAAVIKHLSQRLVDTHQNIGQAVNLNGAALLETLQLGCQLGQLMYDIAADVYRLRPLTNIPLNQDRLEYRNATERHAYDLLARKGAITLLTENRSVGRGVEISAKVDVKEDKREYRPSLRIEEDGQVSKADCSCNLFRKQGLKQGPCSHLVGLRLAYAQLEEKRRTDNKLRHIISVETKTFSKRQAGAEHIYQLTLNQNILSLRWGKSEQTMRSQRLYFNSLDQARDDYLQRLDQLQEKGFLDLSAG